jgi:hypothetical protein
MDDEITKTDWKVGDKCLINGVVQEVMEIYPRFNSLPDCLVKASAYFEDMEVLPE